jgi:thiol-disulfide isomerase/thioredoxin
MSILYTESGKLTILFFSAKNNSNKPFKIQLPSWSWSICFRRGAVCSPSFIYFFTKHCISHAVRRNTGPCQTIAAPLLEKLSTEFDDEVSVYKLAVDQLPLELAENIVVRAIPTFLLMRNGEMVDEVAGVNPPGLEVCHIRFPPVYLYLLVTD